MIIYFIIQNVILDYVIYKLIEKRGENCQFHCVWYEHPLIFCKTKGKKRCPICMGFRNCDCLMEKRKILKQKFLKI